MQKGISWEMFGTSLRWKWNLRFVWHGYLLSLKPKKFVLNSPPLFPENYVSAFHAVIFVLSVIILLHVLLYISREGLLHNLLNTVLNAGQPKRHLLTTGWSVFVSSKKLLAGDFVLFSGMFILSVFKTVTSYLVLSPSHQMVSVWLIFTCLIALSGMTIISFCWEFAGQIGHKLSCHLQSYQVIACILLFLLQLLMLLRQIAGLQFSTTQGRTSIAIYFSGAFPVKCFNICFCRQALQILSYCLQNMSRPCIIPVYLWGCVSGCLLRQKRV
jgi:hypothetical protein